MKLSGTNRRILFRHYVPWALQAARRSTHLMSIEYEKHFDRDLEECREAWNVLPCPKRETLVT